MIPPYLSESHEHGATLARVVGTLVIALGLGVLIQPALLAAVSM